MNNSKIEWCDYTWNPVTGCKHGCPYCYARKQAENPFYEKAFPYKFEPHLYPERFGDPLKVRNPAVVFVCSMADLFGNWVSDKWIYAVGEACDAAPQHTYIFLTKNPGRYRRLSASFFKGNKYFGTTVTCQEDYYRIMDIRSLPDWINTFISFEPLLGNYFDMELDGIKQVIIGAQTKPFKEPDHFTISAIECEAERVGAKVFCKDSLLGIPIDFMRDLAWTIHKPKVRAC